jgi:hypothetical protein
LPAAGLPIVPHRSSLAAAPLRFAPSGDLARRVIVYCPFAGFARALLCGDGGGAADRVVEVVYMLWRWIVRRVRVEVALWQCYWGARRRGDWWSWEYCARHSILLRVMEVLVVVALCILLPLTLDGAGVLLRWLLGR